MNFNNKTMKTIIYLIMRKVTVLIAIIFISTGVMGQSKQFDLDELISLLDKDKFEMASVAMAKDYELAQNDGNTITLKGFDIVNFFNFKSYALNAVFQQKDGTISNQPVAITYMFEVNTEFEEFNSQLKSGNWKTVELQPIQDGFLGKAYTNEKVKVAIGIIPLDEREDMPYKYFVGVMDKDAQDFDISAMKEEALKAPSDLYPSNESGAGGKDGESSEAQNANQGDKDGTVDSRALYGNSGGGGGSSLNISGWMWDSMPNPKDISSESGKLVFQIVIDNKGNTIRVKTLESSVSPTLEKAYRDEVMKLKFSKTAGTSVANNTTGIITFIIEAR